MSRKSFGLVKPSRVVPSLLRVMMPVAMLAAPAMALADDTAQPEARLMGYRTSVALPAGATSLTWITMIILSVVCVGVLFLSAKRSHLD